MKRPRVHHVITRLIAGGAQENTILACQALRDRYEILLLSGPPEGREGSLVEDARRRGLDVRLLPDLVRPVSPARDGRAFRALKAIFEAERPDIVHTHSSKAGILGRWAAWAAGVPLRVHGNHGLPFHRGQSPVLRALYRAAEGVTSRITTATVCVGEEMRRQTLAFRLGRRDNTTVVRSGIETQRFVQAASCRPCLGIPEDAKVVGVVSRMASHKGHRLLVEAAPPDAVLLFVGDGEEREAVEAGVRRRGLKAVFAGHVPPEAVPDLIASMDVLAHPSMWEGLPRAAVQAQIVGRPVVAFDCDGAREVVEEGRTGRLVPPGSVPGLAAALVEILSLPDRGRAWGLAGRERMIRLFDADRCAADLGAVYERLLTGSPSTGTRPRSGPGA